MLVTNKEIKMNFRGYEITIPKGTVTTHRTALGIDEKYNFINDFSWIPSNMPLLKHDAIHYGIDIPRADIETRLYDIAELKEGEIFLANSTAKDFPSTHLQPLKTLRLGNVAFDINGNILEEWEGMKPMFIHTSEYNEYNRIMENRMKR